MTAAADRIVANLIRAYIRSNLRGRTRLTLALARVLPALQAVPVVINQNQRVFVDLRDHLTHSLLAGSPWAAPPAEPDEQLVMRQVVRSGDVVLDIGAHMGLHTVLLSELVGTAGMVHAFEANPERIPTLSVTIGHLANAALHSYGLADCSETTFLFVPEEQAMASLADWTAGRVGPTRTVACRLRTLDDVIADGSVPQPDFIKCDVEGAELRVFEGARHVLDRPEAPVVLYEANAHSASAFHQDISGATDLLRSFAPAAYTIFHVQPHGTLALLNSFRSDCDHYNLLAVPRSRYDRLTRMRDRISEYGGDATIQTECRPWAGLKA
jgi:FkbM family methyltransferase